MVGVVTESKINASRWSSDQCAEDIVNPLYEVGSQEIHIVDCLTWPQIHRAAPLSRRPSLPAAVLDTG